MHTTPFSARLALADAYTFYVGEARAHETAGRIDAAWACLEAAHIIGQRATRLHVSSHVAMLGLAWRTRNLREVRGQAGRSVTAALFTWLWVPPGNPGRATISVLATAPIPRDLQTILVSPAIGPPARAVKDAERSHGPNP